MVIYRSADRADIPHLDELVAVCSSGFQEWIPKGQALGTAYQQSLLYGDDARRKRITRQVMDADRHCQVAECEQGIIGFSAYNLAKNSDGTEIIAAVGHLGMLFVHPQRWGGNTAPILLHNARLDMIHQGYARMQLVVHRDNARARSFYEREGLTTNAIEFVRPGLDAALLLYTQDLNELAQAYLQRRAARY